MQMRTDQVQDFFKHFLRHLKYDDDLPRDLREELSNATNIQVSSSMEHFAINFVDEQGVQRTYQFTAIQQPPKVTGVTKTLWELVG